MQNQKELTRSDFSSLDIFLFSNGQEDSPPRKYNLRADELNWWDATLTHLARSHYGSKHSGIELYTVEGRRVAGPRELRADAAYVAVAPPDRFVQSGYDKYLIKASRSWEKRQERKGSHDALSLTEKDKNDSNNTSDVRDTTNIKIYQDITIVPTSSPIAAEPSMVKTNTDSKAKQNGPKPDSGKQLQKRKISGPQLNPSILRKKYVNPVNPMGKKGSIPSKENSKVEPVKKKVDSRVIKNSQKEPSLTKDNSPVIAQINENKVQSSERIYSINQVIQEEIRENQEPSMVIIETIAENELSQKQDNVDKDILSKIYHNEEHHQSIFINPNIPVKNNAEVKQKYESLHETSEIEHKVVINSVDTDQKTAFSESYYEVHGNESKTNATRTSDATGIIDKKLIVSGNQTSDSFAIFINQGETIKLKLDIEIKSIPVPIEEHNCKSPDCKARKSEKATQGQVAMDEQTEPLQNYCERSGQPVHRCCLPLPRDNLVPETVNDLKTIVCQCTCCPNSEKTFKAAPIYFDNNNYFILLPSEKLNGNLLGISEKMVEVALDARTSIKLEIYLYLREGKSKVLRTIKLHEKRDDCEGSKSLRRCNCMDGSPSKIEIDRVTNEQNIIVVTEVLKGDSLDFAKERLSILKTGSKTSNCDQSLKHTVLPTSTTGGAQTTVGSTERRVSIENLHATGSAMIGSSSSKFSDVATQTDWARLLLEVRLQEDGHYSFHMPPLEILKIYDVL